jgi:hypothetical protein
VRLRGCVLRSHARLNIGRLCGLMIRPMYSPRWIQSCRGRHHCAATKASVVCNHLDNRLGNHFEASMQAAILSTTFKHRCKQPFGQPFKRSF